MLFGERGKKFEFSNVEFDLQSANIKVRRVPHGNEGLGFGTRTRHDEKRGACRASCISRGALALGIRLEFVRGVSSVVTSSQERRQFCFIASGRESFSETLLQEVPLGRTLPTRRRDTKGFSSRPVEADRKGREILALDCLFTIIPVLSCNLSFYWKRIYRGTSVFKS